MLDRLGDALCWIIDPIDGTKSFIRGLPIFACLIGLELDGVWTRKRLGGAGVESEAYRTWSVTSNTMMLLDGIAAEP